VSVDDDASPNDIVVTGLGCISALGQSLAEFSQNLWAGKDGTRPISLFDCAGFECSLAGEVSEFVAEDHFDKPKILSFMDRYAQFAVVSAREAVKHADLDVTKSNNNRIAVVCGSGGGGHTTLDQNYLRLYGESAKRLHPATVAKVIPSSAASHISLDLGVTGPVMATTSACSSSGHAVITGAMMLKTGQCDVALCGGSEAPLTFGVIRAWESMRVLSPDKCRPFSKGRGGLVMGEGAATLVIETRAHALARGATILAELVGYAMTADASHVVAPDVNGPMQSMRAALELAGVNGSDIDYINAHGSGTQQNDVIETQAINNVFGKHATSLAISSCKSMFGHTLGAASALEAVATVAAIVEQTAPPTVNYIGLDRECDLDYVPNTARQMPIRYALSNSFAFGGLNTSLLFKQH